MFKPGDLVMVVKPSDCCGSARNVGRIYTVDGYMPSNLSCCGGCGMIVDTLSSLVSVGQRRSVDEHRIIKIDPLTEQDKTETLQEITA
jgi:hypothetical protein